MARPPLLGQMRSPKVGLEPGTTTACAGPAVGGESVLLLRLPLKAPPSGPSPQIGAVTLRNWWSAGQAE